jgi:tetratricopeptide (TPR) repeat protein
MRTQQVKVVAALEEATRQKAEAEHREQEARQANQNTQAVLSFFDDMLSARDPVNPLLRTSDTLLDRLLLATQQLDREFEQQPLIKASICNTLALSYNTLLRADLALPYALLALDLRRRAWGEDDPSTLSSMQTLADTLDLYSLGDSKRPERDRRSSDMDRLAAATAFLERHTTQQSALREQVFQRRVRVLGPDHRDTLDGAVRLAQALSNAGKRAEAEALLRDVMRRRQRVLGDSNAETAQAVTSLGRVLRSAKRAEAEALYRQTLDRYRTTIGTEHRNYLECELELATLLYTTERAAEAEPLLRHAMDSARRGLDTRDFLNSRIIFSLASVLIHLGRRSEAEPLLREVLEWSRRQLGPDHALTLAHLNDLGTFLKDGERGQEAVPVFEELFTRCRFGSNSLSNRMRVNYMSRLGLTLIQMSRYHEAEGALRQTFDTMVAVGIDRGNLAETILSALADVCERTSRPDEAANWREKIAASQATTRSASAPVTDAP